MIQSTKRDQYWSFWYLGGQIIKIRSFFEEKRVLEVIEAIEISEAAKVNEAA